MIQIPGNPIDNFTSEIQTITIQEPPKVEPLTTTLKTEVVNHDLIQITDEEDSIQKDLNKDNTESDGTDNQNPDVLQAKLFDENPDPETPLIFAEIMPQFGNCYDSKNEDQKANCTSKNITEYLQKNIKFPEIDKKSGNEGIVYIQFIVDENGKVKNSKILRGVNTRLDNEALRVINQMPDWKPGKKGIKNVSVVYNIGINFSLK